jgi:hydroxyacid-oxoacid transhydrogenase
MVSRSLVRAVEDPSDDEARSQMILASCFAGIGFGNAGVHPPHGMSYPVAGMVRDYVPAGYVSDHPIIPHGLAVVLNAPAVFRFTAPADPQRHLYAARLMGADEYIRADVSEAGPEDAGELVASALVDLMRRTGMPNGLSAVGYGPGDVPALVAGTTPQQRVTKLCPRPFDEAELAQLFLDSMRCW